MPEIDPFIDAAGGIDRVAWGHDIIARLMEEMELAHGGISTREFCRLYFDREDTETMILVGQQLQGVRHTLENAATPLFLLNSHYRWYVVPPDDEAMARQFIVNRTRRILSAYERLGRAANIGKSTYQISDTDTLIQAIEGQAPTMRGLGNALRNPNLQSPPPP